MPVDDRCQVVGATDVWAIGDVTGISPFTHTSHYQGRVVAANLNGVDTKARYTTVPRAVYTTPAMTAVGHTRATAREAGLSIVEVQADISSTVRAVTDGSRQGRLVLLADADRRTLVGATAIGGRCEEWISLVSMAIQDATPLDALVDVVRPFPTFGEVLEGCLWELRGRGEGVPA